MRLISQSDVPALLPMEECLGVMHEALSSLARGEAILPLRPMLRLPEQAGIMGLMPAYLGSPASLGVKVITVFNANHGTAFDSHQGVVLLFDTTHGNLLAVIDASSVTAIRTAAVSGVATRALARQDADDLCIIGSGVQADSHLEAMLLVRPISRVRVWSRTPANARAFAERASARHSVDVERMSSAREAVEGAHIVCTVTSARHPVVEGEWLAPGAHVNAVGSSTASARELDGAAVARCALYVDRRESALNEAGDFLLARGEGLVTDDHIRAELGDVLIGRAEGRRSPDEITLFKSLGLAVEDVAAARHIHAAAVAREAGVELDLGGRRG
jgi:ornithine cyclodeaminase/alanine dehydrogenase-like protein (mu-crystallin family)